MQISLKWINEIIDIKSVTLDEFITKLTLGGFEVEEIFEIETNNEKTITLEISATANRSDSLSIQGLALEISALLNSLPKTLKYNAKTFNWPQNFQKMLEPLLIDSPCLEFIALTVENLETLTSPKWLKEKLIVSGITPENDLTDFQNYILLETGYPFEFYDLDKIYSQLNQAEFNLSLKSEKDLRHFSTATEIPSNLTNSILTLQATSFPIGLAGITSRHEVSYFKTSKSLLIEGSIFTAAYIRKQSRVLGVRTDRSSRYEKSLKKTNLLKSFYRLVCLLRISNPNLCCKVHTMADSLNQKSKTIGLDYNNLKQILGPIKPLKSKESQYISHEIITDLLNRLGFQTFYNQSNSTWQVNVSDLRSDDIIQEIDLIEEIGRLYGFNNFLTRLPPIKKLGRKDFHYQTRKRITSCLTNLGLSEFIEYSLVKENTYLKNEIQLINPLVTDYSNLRTSLLPNLIKTIKENRKKSNSIVEGFEYGHVFSITNSEKIQEKEHLAGIFGGVRSKISWSDQVRLVSWFEAKGKLEQLFKKLNLQVIWQPYLPKKEKHILHPYRTSELHLTDGNILGIFGQIHPTLEKSLNLPSDIYLFELDFELIQNQIQKNKLSIYHGYSPYPKIMKDLSFIVENKISFAELKQILYLNGSKFLTEINLLDEYQGTLIPNKHTSLCLQLIFQSDQETLQNKKIEMIMNNLQSILVTKFNASIRN